MIRTILKVHDQFCGAGGSSCGVRNASKKYGGNIEVSLAMNHWKLAIETHSTNFPKTDHDCADMSAVDPRRYTHADILITSPECTNHTLAKGVKRKYQDTNTLFGNLKIDPSAERSRATMWDVPRFAEFHNYKIVIVENVVEARNWIMWDAWLHAMHNLGYFHKCVYLNSMHALPTPQSRDRMYVIFWKKGNKTPNLEITPEAHCEHCGKDILAIQSWKDSRKKSGKYKQQYTYRCPICTNEVEPYHYSAFNVIDWSVPGKRIGDRKTPLVPNTVQRIEHGLKKHKDFSFVIYTDHSSNLQRSTGISDPMFTQATRQVAALVTKGSYQGDIMPLDNPLYTMTTQNNFGVIGMPLLIDEHNKNGQCRTLDEHISTVLAGGNHHGLVGVPFIVEARGQSNTRAIESAISTQTSNINHGILSTESANAFLSYYYGNSQSSGMFDAVGTISTKDRVALCVHAKDNLDINDCTYRMLQSKEVQAAMAFDQDYIICGSGKDKVKQLGNAVTPPAMELLIDRCIQTLL
jgi:DNA (cytosine-5)-methyltransferase 1